MPDAWEAVCAKGSAGGVGAGRTRALVGVGSGEWGAVCGL